MDSHCFNRPTSLVIQKNGIVCIYRQASEENTISLCFHPCLESKTKFVLVTCNAFTP